MNQHGMNGMPHGNYAGYGQGKGGGQGYMPDQMQQMPPHMQQQHQQQQPQQMQQMQHQQMQQPIRVR
jgi:hypothetical protein